MLNNLLAYRTGFGITFHLVLIVLLTDDGSKRDFHLKRKFKSIKKKTNRALSPSNSRTRVCVRALPSFLRRNGRMVIPTGKTLELVYATPTKNATRSGASAVPVPRSDY